MHECATFPATVEFGHVLFAEGYLAISVCMNRPILTQMCILPWTELEALLANKNFPGTYNLATKALHAAALRLTISAVLGGSPCFFMSHLDEFY